VNRLVWIIDAEHWPRAYLRAELIERGYDAVGFATVGDALAMLAVRPRTRPAVATVDLQAHAPAATALAPLLRAGFPVLAIAGLTTSATDTLRGLPWARFLRRPLSIGAIADEVGRLVERKTA
jgi:DNA-binding response OmpR family regulator